MTGRGPRPRRGRLFDALWPVLSYLWTNVTAFFGFLLFFVLNRTTVVGREHVPHERNTLLLSNHQSMIDSWLVGIAACYPESWWKPFLIPWNPAAEENFYATPLLRLLSDLWRVIPIREGRRDIKALYRMTRALDRGVMILFPEGTRTRDGSVGEGRAGAGLVTLGTQPTVIPVAIDGMRDVLPIGSRVPRIGQRIHVLFGEPLAYDDLKDRPRSKETAQELVDRAIERVREQLAEIRRERSRERS